MAQGHAPGRVDHLSRFLTALRNSDEHRRDGERRLADYVEAERRDLDSEEFAKWDAGLQDRIHALARGADLHDKRCALLAIDELLDVKHISENSQRTTRMARSINCVTQSTTDAKLLKQAARTLGRLVQTGGGLTADIVETEVKAALERLSQSYGTSERRLVACYMLKELAEASPAVFNVHVKAFIDVIWNALRDAQLEVRLAAVSALRACLVLVEQRETRYRVQGWYRLFEQTMKALVNPLQSRTNKDSDVEAYVHASLLALGELLEHTREFMLARYREAIDTVMKFRESRHPLVKQAVISLIPKMAAFAPEKFALSYLDLCTTHLLHVISSSQHDRPTAFVALGSMATALAKVSLACKLAHKLPSIEQEMRDAFAARSREKDPSRKAACMEALQCVGVLAESLGRLWQPHALALLQPMILTGLSDPLVKSLLKVTKALPDLLPEVQTFLLEPVLLTLPARLERPPTAAAGRQTPPPATLTYKLKRPWATSMQPYLRELRVVISAQEKEDGKKQKLTKLALDTLIQFDFGRQSLLEFTEHVLLSYMRSPDALIRKSSALAAWKVTERQWGVLRDVAVESELSTSESLISRKGIVERVIARLLQMAVGDVDPGVRKSIMDNLLSSFAQTNPSHRMDRFFAQAESMCALRVCLNDECMPVRNSAITLMGSLADTNPAAVYPALRRHLHQLLTDIENCLDSKHLEESTLLLSSLITTCPNLVLPNLAIIQSKLVAKLVQARQRIAARADGKSKSGHSMTTSILKTIGCLAQAASVTFRPYVPEVLPLVVEAICDTRVDARRIVAVATLGHVVGSTGTVIQPFTQYPQLLGVLLALLHDGSFNTRRKVVEALGVIGALDPHTHKQNQALLTGEGKLDKDGVRGAPLPQTSKAPVSDTGDLLGPASGLQTTSEDFYPTVAINALLKQLRDSKMAPHHSAVVSALMYIFKSLQLGSVQYLPQVLPVLFQVVHVSDENLQVQIFSQLVDLVQIVQGHMRRYLQDILTLIDRYWDLQREQQLRILLTLLAQLASVLQDDFRHHVADLLPKFVSLFQEAERSGNFAIIEPGLKALQALGLALDEYFHLLLPSLVRLLPITNAAIAPMPTRLLVLNAMSHLLPRMHLTAYASAVLHPLICTLSSSSEALREAALDTICSVAVAIGPDTALFLPTIDEVLRRNGVTPSERFVRLKSHLTHEAPPCVTDTSNWEDASGWAAEMDIVQYNEELAPPPNPNPNRFPVQQDALKRAWESSQRYTKDDWMEWMRHLSVQLLCQSPSPALRACHELAQLQPSMARELFAVGFVSCWLDIDDKHQKELVRSLEAALASPSIPPEIVTALLNLAEFMEHDGRPLPLDTRTLGALAEKCHAFAKALHYKELEFKESPHTAVEALIQLNNQLRQPDAANGMLLYAQKNLQQDGIALQESWYEKLQRWGDAISAYNAKLAKPDVVRGSVAHWEATLGKMRCLAAKADWEDLVRLCKAEWSMIDPARRQEMAAVAAHAAWRNCDWAAMHTFVESMEGGSESSTSTGAFLRAVLNVKNGEADHFASANHHVNSCRELLSTELAALVGESYSRAYKGMVRAQQCTELQEVIQYKRAVGVVNIHQGEPGNKDCGDSQARMALIRNIWRLRIQGVEKSVDVWQSLLSVRMLVVPMRDDPDVWLKFAALCRKDARPTLAYRTLVGLLDYDPVNHPRGTPGYGAGSNSPQVMMAYLKNAWLSQKVNNDAKHEVLDRLASLITELDANPAFAHMTTGLGPADFTPTGDGDAPGLGGGLADGTNIGGVLGGAARSLSFPMGTPAASPQPPLIAKAYLYLGLWSFQMHEEDPDCPEMSEQLIQVVSSHLQRATQEAVRWGKAWHHFALFNTAAAAAYKRQGLWDAEARRVRPAIRAFFQSIALNSNAGRHSYLQDILRLLTLWFDHGEDPEVQETLQNGFAQVPVDTWLVVIPQMMARIHSMEPGVRKLVFELLVKVGYHHPQALMYPLLVATKSASQSRRTNAKAVVDEIKVHSAILVDQAYLVSQELIRIAILWHEQWHEALEEASRQYFGEFDVKGMLDTLRPLHDMMREGQVDQANDALSSGNQQRGPVTMSEMAFLQSYGAELADAYEWCEKYKETGRDAELQQAWDLYYHVFKRINKQLTTMTTLDLNYVAPALMRAQGLELAVPGSYIAGEPVVTIASFSSKLQVISSKQRPRRLTIHGGDGAEYQFLLKGHEDLRQDERVMQLFGLVNNLLANDRSTAERDLSIARYAVIPLSPNSGLIGWVRNCDTLHALIREYRDSKKIHLNIEHRMMQQMAPDYDSLMVIQKVEVFEHALASTSGDDLHKVLWLKSRNSEVWLDRRTNYTRSMAVMSMVGYLLGLGDRHPSNLMLDRYSGKLVHIDFGDCFEASMHRDKFPEKVPFRLTRMMVKAMEVSGIEGNFRTTCEQTMAVLRTNKKSVTAMLDAFVHDPLINWRLMPQKAGIADGDDAPGGGAAAAAATHTLDIAAPGRTSDQQPDRTHRERETLANYAQIQTDGGAQIATEMLNKKAQEVLQRIHAKLDGQDFGSPGVTDQSPPMPVRNQVKLLIEYATNNELLCQSYIGWCPFW